MEGYIGEIRGFAGNFAPRTWAFCEGQLLAISSNTALFSILGTIYGGDGQTTFALPDLRGRVMIGSGQGPGLSDYREGQRGGYETVALTTSQIPSHNHSATMQGATASIPASSGSGTTDIPTPTVHLARGVTTVNFAPTPTNMYAAGTDTTLGGPISISGSPTIGNTGGNQSHENRQPYLAINWIICQLGIFPSRN
uniref:phage tail protein n=2 Tax=Roseivirga sp. TaxID=1964215 RepID=UPI004047EBD5